MPQKPVHIQPGLSYVHISTSKSPLDISSALASNPEYKLHYLGPVGELEGEHIFEVQNAQSEVVRRDQLGEKEVLHIVKAVDGVKGAKVLETKQRAKRDEF